MITIFLGHYKVTFAQSQPVVTRWIHPQNLPQPKHEPMQVIAPSIFERIDLPIPPDNIIHPPTLGRICIVVEWTILYGVQSALQQYQQDLAQAGYTSVIYSTSGSAESLRGHLAKLHAEPESLVGAVLIGNIPYIVYEVMNDFHDDNSRTYQNFPCDLFYMDLDGIWSDVLNDEQVIANNGKYDTRTGNLDIEIWVSRIKTDTLTSLNGAGATLINTYFNKNHRFRIGSLAPAKQGLVYDDDDWEYWGDADRLNVQRIYGSGNVTTIFDAEITTAADYKQNRLTQIFEMIAIRSHGWAGGHGFYQNGKTVMNFIYQTDYTTLDPQALFYSLFVCSGSDYTAQDYLAGTIAFNPDNSGLVAWGSTKTGGMWHGGTFYMTLGGAGTIGDAFKKWFNEVQSVYSGYYGQSYVASWWYGMVIIGDGSLKITKTCQPGDLDCNGAFNIYDMQRLINCIFSKGSCANGDLNSDGKYNIFDVQQLVNKIFKP